MTSSPTPTSAVNTPPIVTNIQISGETPSLSEFFVDSYKYFMDNVLSLKSYKLNDFQKDIKFCFERITVWDISLIIVLTIVWTFGRFLVTKHIFKPIGSYFQLSRQDSAKMPESAWKFLFYLSTWSSMAYIILVKKRCSYFINPSIVWQNYSIDSAIETDIYVIYLIQLSFYCHSLYSTLRVDQWRKDSPTLMVHHVLCVLLISISLATKTHKSGLFAMFLHDGCDILLEGTKLSRYFKVQGGKTVKNMDIVTNIGFGCFIMAWLYCRLYCYPLKQVYMASVYVSAKQIKVPFILPIVAMLWVLLMMNVYWFTFILKLLYKVITGQIKELDDNREYSEDKSSKTDEDDKLTNGRYYLRQRKIDYSLLHTGRSQ